MTVGVTFPVLSNWQGLVVAVNSIVTELKTKLFIVDNSQAMRSVSESWNKACDVLFEDSNTPYVWISNDDVIFPPYLPDALVDLMEKDKDIAFLSPTNIQSEPEEIRREKLALPVLQRLHRAKVPNPDFSCFVIRRETWEEVGRFDENFYPAFFEDNDYHARIVLSGLHAYRVSLPYLHIGSLTQNRDKNNPVCSPKQFCANRDYFIRKWGHEPVSEEEEMKKVYYPHPFNGDALPLSFWPDPRQVAF